MNNVTRRTAIVGAFTSFIVAPSIIAGKFIEDSDFKTCKNFINIECSYSVQLAKDLKVVHDIDIEDAFASIYGTSFDIAYVPVEEAVIKILNLPKHSLKFCFKSNDDRDYRVSWISKRCYSFVEEMKILRKYYEKDCEKDYVYHIDAQTELLDWYAKKSGVAKSFNTIFERAYCLA